MSPTETPRRHSHSSLASLPSAGSESGAGHNDDEDEGEPLFLGLDCSTQALKCSLLDSALEVLAELEVRFDRDLPHYSTQGGTLTGPEGTGEVHSPVLMCVEALDMLCDRIKEKRWPTHRVRGVSAAGQQHASVYWSHEASSLLSTLDYKKRLVEQLDAWAFSRQIIPNWQDSSTSSECREMEACVGGATELARLTGSRAHERFTGPQIARFRRVEPDAYEATDRISLVSSFITTLLCADGEINGIDESDAPERGWNEKLLAFVAGEQGAEGGEKQQLGPKAKELKRKLGVVESDNGRVVGHIGRWFRKRYGFPKDCVVAPGTGDNPATYLSFVLGDNEGLVSLGTSDTILVSTSSYNPHPEFHTFAHPAQLVSRSKDELEAGHLSSSESSNGNNGNKLRYFAMLVYKNGSLARENVRDQYFNKSWDQFNQAVESSTNLHSTEDGRQKDAMGFYWYRPDIIPSGAYKVQRFVVDGSSSLQADMAREVREFEDPKTNAPVILQSQFLNYRVRSSGILASEQHKDCASASSKTNGHGGATAPEAPATLKRVFAVGGAAANLSIIQTLSDVLGCEVCKPFVEDQDQDDADADGDNHGVAAITDDFSKKVSVNVKKANKKNADFNSCSVAAAYKAKWAYMRLFNAQHAMKHGHSTTTDGHESATEATMPTRKDISFENMVSESKHIRRLRRRIAKRMHISSFSSNVSAASTLTTNSTATAMGGAGGAARLGGFLGMTSADATASASAFESALDDEDEEVDAQEGVVVVASPREERTAMYARRVQWWQALEQRAVQASISEQGVQN
ncbi:actin-like ATPase domain-containing protein [Tilletiaria anomala UBC 951]|uniref:Xylulose kinase n=1 Tax=Tilletiaria anomala (strain ATCC 24038 / CBS 436.72 / UBC 951) TaxID=1037660 RepID=A0A066WBJ7_TILAU|nr:actin-like ATPase domain-containing protein [Tilletiaria anomala UBC 951]KDN51312.1 actin-like ATPase domain-containing protein [Tilletiaria anomala UBC 951]